MVKLYIQLPPKFAASCLMGLLYNLERSYNLTYYGDHVEVAGPDPYGALQDVLTTAHQIVSDRSRHAGNILVRIPGSGNDKRVLEGLWRAYGLRTDADIFDFIKVVQANLDSKEVGQHPLPTILKPEYYEYNRLPGYTGESVRIMRSRLPALSVSLSLIGYVVCRVGRAQKDKKSWVSVVVTPELQTSNQPYAIDPEYRLLTFVEPIRLLNDYLSQPRQRYNFAGLFPETALHLWLAAHMGGAKINLYALNEPRGQNPATIYSSMKFDLELIHKRLTHYDLYKKQLKSYLVKISENALRAVEKSAAKHLSIRFSILLYEVLSGMKPVEEFVYVASREYFPWSLSPPEQENPAFKSYQVSRWAAFLAKQLTKAGGLIAVD